MIMRIVKPKLRFKEFQHEWERVSFTDCCDLIHGFQFRDEHFSEIGFPVVKIGNLLDTSGLTFKNVSYVPEDFKDQFERFILYPNDILMALTGGTLGKVSKVEKDYGVIFQNYRVGKFVPKENAIKDFIYFILQSKVIQARVKSLVNEAAQPNFGKQDFDKIKVGIPSLPEQQKIASFLSAVDEKIQQFTRKKELLEQYKKGVMQQLFSGKLRFKDENGKAFPDWEEKRLGDIAERVVRRNKENNLNVLTISAQMGLVSQLEYFNKNVAAKDLTNYYLLERGEFAYNKSYSAGYPMGAIKRLITYNKGVLSTLYICFRFRDDVSLEFIEQYFETGKQNSEIEKVAQEGARNHGLLNIGVGDFFNIQLTLPSIKEQRKIASYLSSLDNKIKSVSNQIAQSQAFKKALLQQMFV
jgi:type I restriction enzyme S subunit